MPGTAVNRVSLTTPLLLERAGPGGAGREYRARFIRAGRVRHADNSPGPYTVPAGAIKDALAAGQFLGLATFVDHAGCSENPSLHNLAGRTVRAEWNALTESADGTIRLFDTAAGRIVADLFEAILADEAAGDPIPDVGLSLVFWPRWAPPARPDACPDEGWDGGNPLTLDAFRHIESVDFVFQPAADGRVREALRALRALRPADGGPVARTGPNRRGAGLPRVSRGLHAPDNSNQSPTMEVNMPPERTNEEVDAAGAAPSPAGPVPGAQPHDPVAAMPVPSMPRDTRGHERTDEATAADPVQATAPRAWRDAMRQAAIDNILAASGLPAATQAFLRSQDFQSPEALTAAIEAQRAHIAELRADDVVQVGNTPPRASGVALGRAGLEHISAATEALIMGTRPPAGVQPLSGLRELYHLLSGDYEMYGVFQPDRVYLANVTSSTMAGLVANALNKAVVNAFQVYPHWWEKIVTIMDFNNLQDVRWITLGGVGELPTVAEGAAYTELTWDDQTETDSFVKKGGYLGITIEAIDKDDTGQLRAAPRALAQAAWLTLSKSISAIFTDNSGVGPAMSDSNYLFDASNHGNLLTSALSWAEYVTVRIAMMKQTEVNSGERLGGLTAPKYLLVPIDLENTALQILASEGEPGSADNDVNPFALGNTHNALLESARDRVIVVPLWTDTNNWAAVADPLLYPSIGLGFRYGRTPEIFSVASPTAGLMFTNDTLPVKVRFFYATGPTDWRGLHKSNVA